MKGVLLPGNREVVVTSFANPKPAIGEAVVRVKASCICRSDMSLYYGNAVLPGVTPGTCITGHEPAGVVEEVGHGVETFRSGDRVAVYLAVGCGTCPACRRGIFHLCPTWRCIGFTADGGNAEYLRGPGAQLPAHAGLDVVRRCGDLHRRVRHPLQRLQEARRRR